MMGSHLHQDRGELLVEFKQLQHVDLHAQQKHYAHALTNNVRLRSLMTLACYSVYECDAWAHEPNMEWQA